jgi:hypothetical protein
MARPNGAISFSAIHRIHQTKHDRLWIIDEEDSGRNV